MATLKVILDTRSEKKDGTYPVKISVFHKNTTFHIATDISVKKEYWQGGEIIEHQKAKTYNKLIRYKYNKAEKEIGQLFDSGSLSKTTPKALKYFLENGSPTEDKTGEYTIEEHFNRYISNCRAKGTADMYRVTLGKINEFAPMITFNQVNLFWLKSFDTFLSKTCVINTRAIHMRNIRAVFNDAINEDKIEQNLYPFRKFKIKKEATIKRSLTVEQIKQFRDYPVQEHQKKYQELWMLVFYLIGINTVDLVHLKHDNIINGRLEYRRAKTGRLYSINILPEAQAILDKYKGKNYLIDVMDNYTNYKDFSSRFNSNLKKIGNLEWVKNGAKTEKFIKKNKKKVTPIFPNLTIYAARYSVATVMASLDIAKETISAALGHEIGSKTTSIYIDFDLMKVDRAMKDVLAYIR